MILKINLWFLLWNTFCVKLNNGLYLILPFLLLPFSLIKFPIISILFHKIRNKREKESSVTHCKKIDKKMIQWWGRETAVDDSTVKVFQPRRLSRNDYFTYKKTVFYFKRTKGSLIYQILYVKKKKRRLLSTKALKFLLHSFFSSPQTFWRLMNKYFFFESWRDLFTYGFMLYTQCYF